MDATLLSWEQHQSGIHVAAEGQRRV